MTYISWLKRGLQKVIIRLLLAMLIIFCVYQYFMYQEETWVDFNQNNIKGQIMLPKAIGDSKDCKKFWEWKEDNFPDDKSMKCPWEE